MSATGQKVLIYEQTVQNILKLVKERNLTTGDKLPPERELAALLGVSRSCVREALQILAANDYLKIKRSSGIYINLPEIPSDISSLKSAEDKLNLQDIQKLLETRILLETYAIKQTAIVITEEQLQQLYEIEDEAYHSMVDASKSGGKPLVIPASSWSTCWYRSSPTSTSRSFTAASARSGVNTWIPMTLSPCPRPSATAIISRF